MKLAKKCVDAMKGNKNELNTFVG